MANLHKGHRQRVKNQFRKSGLQYFDDHKKLELLLYYSVPRNDTNLVGHRLLERFGSFSGVFDAPYELLVEVPGVGPESATLIKLTAAMIAAYMDDYTSVNNVIRDIPAAKEFMQYKFLCEQRECVYLASLANNGKVIFCDRIAEGSPDKVGIAPSTVVRTALRTNAVQVLLAHNHPNGICNPSQRDLGTTSILFEELRRVEIELIDHIIVAPDGVYSMKEHGMFPGSSL